MTLSYIAVGSNLGDRLQNITNAQSLLSQVPQVRFLRSSAIYETEPVGGPAQGDYLNAVWEIQTSLEPEELLDRLLQIEKQMGRVRALLNGPRLIDLDILFYGREVIEKEGLRIPHPKLHHRGFVLKPLMDLCPDHLHPKLQRTVLALWRDCKDFPAAVLS